MDRSGVRPVCQTLPIIPIEQIALFDINGASIMLADLLKKAVSNH
ncbi:hypothetical protein ACZ87_02836 [Candidatus Erwinia dacicola]|uniref:Uncharacterized protein n=1 Tax=Candidatus Erwinia dacicola TaxID=252393 RepID=A0A328TLW6_9GAMM|nr:hypothetical protein ACZ87_02836 [Candidatus Erwinia dacicola]